MKNQFQVKPKEFFNWNNKKYMAKIMHILENLSVTAFPMISKETYLVVFKKLNKNFKINLLKPFSYYFIYYFQIEIPC